MYADSAPQSLIDSITGCIYCDPVVSPCTGNTYSRKTVVNFGMKDPCSMETIENLIPNRNKQEELEKFYMDKFKETVGNLVSEPIDVHVELIVELIAMVVDRSDLQACLNGQRLLIELIQSSTEDQLGRFKAKLSLVELGMVAKLLEKQNATILKNRLSINISSLANAMLRSSQPTCTVPTVASADSIDGSDDEEEYDFSDTESTTSSVGYADDKTYIFVDKMPRKTTVNDVKQHFQKFKERMIGRVLFIKGSNGTKARLTFKSSESALEAIEMMNKSYFPNSSTPIVVKMWVDKWKQKSVQELAKRHTSRKKSNSESLADEPAVATDVYVGNNLPPSVTENDIKMHFKKFEPHIQRVLLIKDPKTKKSKGFAKVTFTSLQFAQRAVEKLNKSLLPQCKQRLTVNIWGAKKETDEIPPSPTKSIPEEDEKDAEKKSRPRRKQKVSTEQVTTLPEWKDEPKEELIGLTIENVSNLVSGDQLKLMLEAYGNVRRYSITPGSTHYKAEVFFSTKNEADDAISNLNGNHLAGNKILVRYLPVSSEKTGIETFGVYVGKIPNALQKPELEQIFSKYGKILSIHFNPDKKFAFVNYLKMEDAKAALDMNNREVYGSKLRVNMASKKAAESNIEGVPPSLPTPILPNFERTNFPPSLSGRPRERSPGVSSGFTVRIRNLSPLTTKEKLTTLVVCYGSLTSPVHLIKGDPPYAYMNYATVEAAKAACSHLHGQRLDGKALQVNMKDETAPISPGVPPMTSTIPPYETTIPPQPHYSVPNVPQIPSMPSHPQYSMPNTISSSMPNKQRYASARFNKFLHERMDPKLREFASFGGSVKWNNDCLTIEAPSMPVLNEFEIDVLNVLEEDKIVLSSEDWNKLMLMRPDKTSLYHQSILPYRTNPNVNIESQDATLSICIVGMREAVQDVKAAILSELNKEIIVEE